MIGEVLISLGDVKVYTHGFFLALGILLASLVLYFLAKKENLRHQRTFDLIASAVVFGIIFARLSYFVLYRDQFDDFFDLFRIWQGGLVSYGGFLFGGFAFYLVARAFNLKVKRWFDLLAISFLLGMSIGRLGSFLSGELAGSAYEGIFAVSGQHPTTMYESIWTAVLFLVSLVIYPKLKKIPGIMFLEIVSAYSIVRFFVDFFRAEESILYGLSLGQLTSLLVFVVVFIFLVKNIYGFGKGENHA